MCVIVKKGEKGELLFSCSIVSDSFVTPWTVALQVSLSMGFSRQEYGSRLAFPSPGNHEVRIGCEWIQHGRLRDGEREKN